MSNELALANAIASVEMEGLHLCDEGYDLCRQYSDNELTWAEFLVKALEIANKPEMVYMVYYIQNCGGCLRTKPMGVGCVWPLFVLLLTI